MKVISLIRNTATGQHIAIDGPRYSDSGSPRNNATRVEYGSLDAMANCLANDLNLNTKKSIKVYFYDYPTEDKVELTRRLECYFTKIKFVN